MAESLEVGRPVGDVGGLSRHDIGETGRGKTNSYREPRELERVLTLVGMVAKYVYLPERKCFQFRHW